jgi:hypothetical protein
MRRCLWRAPCKDGAFQWVQPHSAIAQPEAIGTVMENNEVAEAKMQHYSCNLAPVGTLRIRVEQAQIRDDVPLVVVNTESEDAVSATSGSSGGFCMGVLAIGC